MITFILQLVKILTSVSKIQNDFPRKFNISLVLTWTLDKAQIYERQMIKVDYKKPQKVVSIDICQSWTSVICDLDIQKNTSRYKVCRILISCSLPFMVTMGTTNMPATQL